MPSSRTSARLVRNLRRKGHLVPSSSVIHRMHYDPKKQVLTIVYVSGKVYDYKGVPEKVYEEMKTAFSKGEFLNYHIKGKYPYKQVS